MTRATIAYAMTAEECEAITEEYDSRAIVMYEGGLVTVKLPPKNDYMVCDNIVDFAAIFRKLRQRNLSTRAVAIYEQSYQCFNSNCTVVIIDGIGEYDMTDLEKN